jgi:hypothetical protein
MGIDIQSVVILAGIGIALWLGLNYIWHYRLGILKREKLNELSLPEAVVIGTLAYSSAYIIAELFSRFA